MDNNSIIIIYAVFMACHPRVWDVDGETKLTVVCLLLIALVSRSGIAGQKKKKKRWPPKATLNDDYITSLSFVPAWLAQLDKIQTYVIHKGFCGG